MAIVIDETKVQKISANPAGLLGFSVAGTYNRSGWMVRSLVRKLPDRRQ